MCIVIMIDLHNQRITCSLAIDRRSCWTLFSTCKRGASSISAHSQRVSPVLALLRTGIFARYSRPALSIRFFSRRTWARSFAKLVLRSTGRGFHRPFSIACIFRDIRPPIPTTSAHLYRGIRPALTRCREALVFDISFLAFRHVVEGLSFGRIVRRVRAGRRCAPAGRGWHLRRWVHQ